MKDIGHSFQNDRHNLRFLDNQQVTERLESTSLDHVGYLIDVASGGHVGDGPHGFLLGLVLSLHTDQPQVNGHYRPA